MRSMKLETLSAEAFNSRKATAIANQVMRKQLSLSEFKVVNNTTIEIDGVNIEMTNFAFKRLLTRLRIPSAFAKRFSEGFGDNGLRELVQMIKSMKTSKNDQTVTLLVDQRAKVITNILPAGYASISNEAFVNFAERYINQYNLEVKDFGSDPSGGCTINCTSPGATFKVPGMSDEVFNTGVTFRNTPQRGLEVSPFLNRLVCSNGISSTQFEESFGLHELTNKAIEEFNQHMIQMASTGFQPKGLAEKIQSANETTASMQEVQRAIGSIMNSSDIVDYDYIQRFVPLDKITKAYSDIGANPAAFTTKQLQNASSGCTIWEIVNGITNFSSNDTKYAINDHKRANLGVAAGNILMRKNYDMDAVLDFNPFANGKLLSESEANILMGQN